MNQQVYIDNVFSIDPPEYLSSLELEEMLSPLYEKLKISKGRLEFITGVQRRGFWPDPMKPSDIAVEAAKGLFRKSSINIDKVDQLIYAGVCRDFEEPSTASFIHLALGLSELCLSFDLSNACLGMISALEVARSMIQSGMKKNVLIVSGENSQKLLKDTVDFLNTSKADRKLLKDFFASLTISSAGSAMLVTAEKNKNTKWEVSDICSRSDSSSSHLCKGGEKNGKLLMSTKSSVLLNNGIELAKSNWKVFLEKNKLYQKKSDRIILHQVGQSHREQIMNQLGLNQENEFSTFKEFGNSGSASIISALFKADEKKFLDQSNTLLMGIGSGLHTSLVYLKKVLN